MVRNSTASIYVDDASLCFKSNDLPRLNGALNRDLSGLERLSLIVIKTPSIPVCTKASNKIQVKIRETELEVVNKSKYLGVQIDKNLDWKDPLKAVSPKDHTAPFPILLFCIELYRHHRNQSFAKASRQGC